MLLQKLKEIESTWSFSASQYHEQREAIINNLLQPTINELNEIENFYIYKNAKVALVGIVSVIYALGIQFLFRLPPNPIRTLKYLEAITGILYLKVSFDLSEKRNIVKRAELVMQQYMEILKHERSIPSPRIIETWKSSLKDIFPLLHSC